MVDVLKTLDFEYIVANPASSFRGLHESFINYGGNTAPEWLTCTHEQASVNIANGYFAVAGKPMAVVTFAPSGLQHAAMGIFGAFSGRTPTYLLCANIPGGEDRRPLFDWGPHAMTDPAAMVRDMLKWDDSPGSLQHFAESAVRAYRMAMTVPRGPVMLVVDAALQEEPMRDRSALRTPKLALASPPAGDSAAVAEVARLLVAAESPLVLAGDVARDEDGMRLLVELAETLQAPVQGGGRGMPNRHPLAGGGNVPSADVILALNEDALYGRLNRYRDQQVRSSIPLTKPGAQVLSISSYDLNVRSNYQNVERFQEVSLAIAADPQATLPALIEACRKLITPARRRALDERGRTLAAASAQALERARIGGDVRLGREPDHSATPRGRSVGRHQRKGLGVGRRERRPPVERRQVLPDDGRGQRRRHRRLVADRDRRGARAQEARAPVRALPTRRRHALHGYVAVDGYASPHPDADRDAQQSCLSSRGHAPATHGESAATRRRARGARFAGSHARRSRTSTSRSSRAAWALTPKARSTIQRSCAPRYCAPWRGSRWARSRCSIRARSRGER